MTFDNLTNPHAHTAKDNEQTPQTKQNSEVLRAPKISTAQNAAAGSIRASAAAAVRASTRPLWSKKTVAAPLQTAASAIGRERNCV